MCTLLCAAVSLHSYMYTTPTGYCGPSPNLVSSPHQETALHWAAGGGHPDTAEYLIQAGADVNIKDNMRVSE